MTIDTRNWNKLSQAAKKEFFENQFKISLITRKEFIDDLKVATEKNLPFAAARIGHSEEHWMYYPILLSGETNTTKIRVFERYLRFYGFSQAGIFPPEPSFYLEYNNYYVESVRNLDNLGLILDPVMTPEIIRFYSLTNRLIYYMDLIPDRSIPSNQNNCYLQYFEGKKILIVCPFADLLKERATKEIFEGVWSKTGKKWFYPKSIDSLEFPYGFARETHRKYSNALSLFKHIANVMERKDFDVALIAAAGLTIPIAAHVKLLGKIGISFGGDLQIIFGVIGKRWREQKLWRKEYFNNCWIDMPEKYWPKKSKICDSGAYW